VFYLTGTFGSAVVVAWGMFRRSRRQARRESDRRAEAEERTGLAATEILRGRDYPSEVIILTTFDTDDHVLRALHAGASGFLLKDTSPADIVRVIRAVAVGEPILSPTITRRLIGHVTGSDGGERRRHARKQLDRLTEREREVAVAIGRGKSNDEISRDLYMSIATVEAHVSHLLEKLKFNNRVQIALLAHDAGEA
jgi:DNA-binding NarL/FixJ family response regulator